MTDTTDPTKEPQSVKGPRVKKGLVVINTGDGKGKTTAALGVLATRLGPEHASRNVPVPEAYRSHVRRKEARRLS